ncbi:hypothetical protein LNP17_14215 [Klebsiella variicola subsp. variicola]|nr:hypothetical protein [Klebsiella variicola subsp. variicola]
MINPDGYVGFTGSEAGTSQYLSSLLRNGIIMNKVYIVAACRTPVGRFLGALKTVSAVELARAHRPPQPAAGRD